jgi:hypothetical protein
MTPLRPSVDYLPLAPLRLDGPRAGRSGGAPSRRSLLRGLLAVAALALPAIGPRIARSPQRPSAPEAVQTAAALGPSPMRAAAVRLP